MLQEELTSQRYQPGAYKTFEIFEPKRRIISAAPYRDRVVHHALCHIIAPIFERTFIHNSYANRTGFGTHKALKKFIEFCRSSRYILQCDIQKYFPSIDLQILKEKIRRKIKCAKTLWLVDAILDNSNSNDRPAIVEYFPGDDLLAPLQRPKGLPIGNLTSQFFANVYLSDFDRFVKAELRAAKYLRYVDDFALFSDNRDFLKGVAIASKPTWQRCASKSTPSKASSFKPNTVRASSVSGCCPLAIPLRKKRASASATTTSSRDANVCAACKKGWRAAKSLAIACAAPSKAGSPT